jgi:hypothetical protein
MKVWLEGESEKKKRSRRVEGTRGKKSAKGRLEKLNWC